MSRLDIVIVNFWGACIFVSQYWIQHHRYLLHTSHKYKDLMLPRAMITIHKYIYKFTIAQFGIHLFNSNSINVQIFCFTTRSADYIDFPLKS